MQFTREQVIEMAREAGFPSMSLDNISDTDADRITRLCTLAADAALEAAAKTADARNAPERIASLESEGWSEAETHALSVGLEGAAEAIRAMKEKP